MKNQSGFGHLPILLAVAVVATVGFGGWYVWDRNKGDSQKSVGQQINETANWLEYEPVILIDRKRSANKFSIKIPDGWKLRDSGNLLARLRDNNLAIQSGVKGEVEYELGSPTHLNPGLYIQYLPDFKNKSDNDAPFNSARGYHPCDPRYKTHIPVGQYSTPGKERLGEEQTPLTTDSGQTILKYKWVHDKQEFDRPAPGGVTYQYCIVKDKQLVDARYALNPNETDYSDNVEKALKTVEFLE